MSPLANALGLGEVELHSYLNQPLEADIKLLKVRDLSESEILIGLASAEDFKRADVERPFFLTDLRFKVDLSNPAVPVVRVTSRNPIREPFLNFLVEIQWPAGRVLREYTLLMDLPLYDDRAAPAPVAATAVPAIDSKIESEAPAPAPEPAPVVEPAPAPEPVEEPVETVMDLPSEADELAVATTEEGAADSSAPQAETPEEVAQETDEADYAATGELPADEIPAQETEAQTAAAPLDRTYGPIVMGDTLWEIALKVRPGQDLSVQQTMLALQELNPDAFINGNINMLKRGAVLRVPDRSEIATVGQQQAVQEVALQNDSFYAKEALPAPLQGASREAQTEGAGEDKARLELLAPDSDSLNASSGKGAGSDSGNREAMQNELAIALEEKDRISRENTDLRSRVQELESQIQTMEKLISASDDQLRAMQLAAQQRQDGQAQDAVEAGSVPAEDAAPQDSAPAEAAPLGSSSESTADAEVAPVTAPEAKPAPKVAVPPPAPFRPEPGIVDLIMDNLLYVLGGVLVILLGIVAWWQRRKATAGFDDDDELNPDDIDVDFTDPLFLQSDSAPDEERGKKNQPLAQASPAEEDEAEDDDGDPISYADIYIAYGKYDEAEEKLVSAIKAEPNRSDLRLKLLEVFAAEQAGDKFDDAYAALLRLDDPAAHAEAADLRDMLPGMAPFDAAAYGVELHSGGDAEAGQKEDIDFADFGLDLDSGSDTGVADEKSEEFLDLDSPLETASGSKAEDFNFDLDLDLSGDTASSSGEESFDFDLEAAPESSVAEDSFDLDLSTDTDSSAGDESFDFDLEAAPESSAAEDSFDLDLSTDTDNSAGDESFDFDLEAAPESSAAEDSFDLDLSTDTDSSAGDDSFDFDLDLGSDSDAGKADDSLSLDLAEASDSRAEDEAFDFEAEQPGDKDTAVSELDDFDLGSDIDDLDLESLDGELEKLTSGAESDDLDFSFDEALDDSDSVSASTDEQLADLPELQDSDFSVDQGPGHADDSDLEDEFSFLSDSDEVATKLDLARAYIDMGDSEGARDILSEVVAEGNDAQRKEAEELLEKTQ